MGGRMVDVGMNIKSERTHRLARKLAAATGETVTTAVTVALEERWERLRQRSSLAERLLEIGGECAARLQEPWRSADHGELLYDDRGLPK
ncbi:MAG: type II toxin-antitoxin system VapB family antitoxin [Terriglobales bacterium]